MMPLATLVAFHGASPPAASPQVPEPLSLPQGLTRPVPEPLALPLALPQPQPQHGPRCALLVLPAQGAHVRAPARVRQRQQAVQGDVHPEVSDEVRSRRGLSTPGRGVDVRGVAEWKFVELEELAENSDAMLCGDYKQRRGWKKPLLPA